MRQHGGIHFPVARVHRHLRAGFTLIEMLLVVSLITLLIALLLPSLQRAREMSRRAVCLANQRHIVTGALQHPIDNKGMFIPCASRSIQLNVAANNSYGANTANKWTAEDVATNWIDAWARRGLMDYDNNPSVVSGHKISTKVWNCPSRRYESQWQVNGSTRVVTTSYQYVGGVARWVNTFGTFKSRSPYRQSSTKPDWVLLADGTIKIDFAWGQGNNEHTPYAYVDMPPHKVTHAMHPEGSTQAYADGSAEWIPFGRTIHIHTWSNNGSRIAYWYQQDLGDYNPPPAAYGQP